MTSEISIDDVEKIMDSNVSQIEKTNFLIQYLLDKREVFLNYFITILIAIIVFAIGRKIVKFVLKILNKWMQRRQVEISVSKFIMSLSGFALNILLIFMVAGILGVGTSSIVALVGSAGLALGLALQGSLSNLAGGVLILLLKPFRIGDYIIALGEEGTVENIDIFYTRILTTDNKVVVIPNGTISGANVTNTSTANERMLILDFMVDYEADTEEVREKILKLFSEDERIDQDKKMSVVICGLTPIKVKMQAKAWVKTEDYWDVRYDMFEKIKKILVTVQTQA